MTVRYVQMILASLAAFVIACREANLAPPSSPLREEPVPAIPRTLPTSIQDPSAEGPSSSSEPAAAYASVADATLAELWAQRFDRLYSSYEKGTSARGEVYREIFAPHIQFIGGLTVSVDKAIAMMEGFFLHHSNPTYTIRGPVEVISENAAQAVVEAKWNEPCPDDWARDDFICFRHFPIRAALEVDDQGKIHKLVETEAPPFRFRVDAPSVEARTVPHSGCDQASADLNLPHGTIVAATGLYILSGACGPCELLIEFRYGGSIYWSTLMSCMRIYDAQTGPRTEAQDFLLRVE